MLLKTLCATALSITSSMAFAVDYGPGCGAGQMMMNGSSGLMAHTSANTVNGTFGQPFSITSGTSGCDTSQQVQRSDDKNIFVASNIDSLSQEIAQGQGDHLMTLAAIMGVSHEDRNTFTSSLQDEYSTVFSSNTSTSTDVLAAIDSIMLSNPNLAKYTR